MKFPQILAAVAVAAAITLPAQAQLVQAPLPANTYISFGGLDWAWAFPLPADEGMTLSYQAAYGWRLPTAAELAHAPLATDFVFVGANVPLQGSDPLSGAYFSATNSNLTGAAACATPYFSTSYSHCDWQDGNGQVYAPWAGITGAQGFADQLVVRAVPEADTYAMLLGGLGLLGLVSRRRRG